MELNKTWSAEEDEIIRKASMLGFREADFSLIAGELPGRTIDAIKSRIKRARYMARNNGEKPVQKKTVKWDEKPIVAPKKALKHSDGRSVYYVQLDRKFVL